MTTLSLAMIAKDEESILGRCLDSIKDFVDEIVIVDTGSTDKTIEIARKYTDKVYHYDWIDDFSAARNYSFEKCTKDFIIWLDCDDVVELEDAKKIRNMDYSDKEMIISDYEYSHDDHGKSECTVPRERIIKRSLGLKWEGRIHEVIPLQVKPYISDIKIHHHRQGGTSKRNLRILENIVLDNNKKIKSDVESRYVYYLGKEYLDAGRIDEAIPYLDHFTTMPGAFWEDVYKALYSLAQCYKIKCNDQKFKSYLFRSLELEERQAEPYCLMGEWCMDKKWWNRAIQWYEMAIQIRRPKDLFASYQPAYYTWIPHLQLCVCYNNTGDIKKAFEHNKEVLRYRPNDQRAVSNKEILGAALKKSENDKKDGEYKRLNFSYKEKSFEDYTNINNFDDIPYKDNTISAVHSEYTLESQPFDNVPPLLKEWNRILMPGGELDLNIVDFEKSCKEYLSSSLNHSNFFKTRFWFKCVIFGIQKDQAGEFDDTKFRKSGFSKDEICFLLEQAGFIIESIENFDNWKTPSIHIKAKKLKEKLKVGWIAPQNWEAAQTRIRVLNIDKWLKEHGYHSEIVNYPEIINQNYDVAVVGKGFDEHHLKNIKMLKQHGKTVFCDLCEDITGWPYVDEILKSSDKIICCSRKLEEKVKPINPNTTVIEDAWE